MKKFGKIKNVVSKVVVKSLVKLLQLVKNIHRNIIFSILKNLKWPISFKQNCKWKFRDCNFVKKRFNFNSI